LVTGSSRGIGRAIALELSSRGAIVVINYHVSEEEGLSVVRELKGGTGLALKADVSSTEQVGEMFQTIAEKLGPVDVLVNNAGITRDKTFQKMTPELWHEVIDVNLHGVVNCCRCAVPDMIKKGGGRIVNISSIVGQLGAFGQTNYATSKAGVLGFTKSLAAELARHGITVNAICPGYIETSMVSQMPQAVIDQIIAHVHQRRLGKPEDVARVARFLVEEGDYITGTTIYVDGGIAGG
jgi:acetoacetyl-CoA reductase